MNRRQRGILLTGFVVLLLMGLFPPYKESSLTSSQEVVVGFGGYGFIFAPPRQESYNGRKDVHTGLLLAQLMCVLGITGFAAVFVAPAGREKDRGALRPTLYVGEVAIDQRVSDEAEQGAAADRAGMRWFQGPRSPSRPGG